MDPTPRGEAVPATSEDLTPQPPLVEPTSEPTTSPTERSTSADTPDTRPTFDEEILGGGAGEAGGEADGDRVRRSLVVVAAVLVLAALLAAWVYLRPTLQRLFARTRGDATTDVLAAQRRVLFTAAHLGVGRADEETVTEVATRWARAGMVDPADAATFARLGSQAAFGPLPDPEDVETMRAVERRLAEGLTRSVDRRQRVTAPWLQVGQQLADTVAGR